MHFDWTVDTADYGGMENGLYWELSPDLCIYMRVWQDWDDDEYVNTPQEHRFWRWALYEGVEEPLDDGYADTLEESKHMAECKMTALYMALKQRMGDV